MQINKILLIVYQTAKLVIVAFYSSKPSPENPYKTNHRHEQLAAGKQQVSDATAALHRHCGSRRPWLVRRLSTASRDAMLAVDRDVRQATR